MTILHILQALITPVCRPRDARGAAARRAIAAALAALIFAPMPGVAGQEPPDEADEVLQAEELGVSLARIQRRLNNLPDDDDKDVLRLNFYVQVYGRAPQLKLLDGFDVHNGPVPYGAPVHRDLLAAMRPSPQLYPPSIPLVNIAIPGWSWRALQP